MTCPISRRSGPRRYLAIAVSVSAVAKQVQLVLTDRTALTEGRDFGVLSPLNWRMADLGAKHALLRAGLGWGHMPLHMVEADLDSGALVKIRVQGLPRDLLMPMRVVFRKDALPGPAARAFIAQLKRYSFVPAALGRSAGDGRGGRLEITSIRTGWISACHRHVAASLRIAPTS